MTGQGAFALLVAAAQAVPTPPEFPKQDFIRGPLNGLMGELRGEKTQPPPTELTSVIGQLFDVGERSARHDLAALVVPGATQSFRSPTYPETGWSGRIEPGFLAKFKGCAHTAPWFDGANGDIQKVHFYWSCDPKHPYILRTDIRFRSARVESWDAGEIPHPVMINTDRGAH